MITKFVHICINVQDFYQELNGEHGLSFLWASFVSLSVPAFTRFPHFRVRKREYNLKLTYLSHRKFEFIKSVTFWQLFMKTQRQHVLAKSNHIYHFSGKQTDKLYKWRESIIFWSWRLKGILPCFQKLRTSTSQNP